MTLRIASLNCNGLRACVRNGFWQWFEQCAPDILCLQEVRMQQEDLDQYHSPPKGWHLVHVGAQKKGYSGVAIWSRYKPSSVHRTIGLNWADEEGRAARIDFDKLSVFSLYFPSGTSGQERQLKKNAFLEFMTEAMKPLLTSQKPVLLCGDVNIAHTSLDIFHDKANANKSGFLPHERQWMTDITEAGWSDVYRSLHPDVEQYSWWSNRSKTARSKNVGWRIDYHLANPSLASLATSAWVDGPSPKISDHAPVVAEYNLSLTS